MDEETKQEIAKLRADLQAIRLAANEALSITLSHESNPDKAVSLARADLERIITQTETETASLSPDKVSRDFQKWFYSLVRGSVSALMDSVEQRVSRLRIDRAIH